MKKIENLRRVQLTDKIEPGTELVMNPWSVYTYVAGPDAEEDIVCLNDNGVFYFAHPDYFAYKPLCIVEDKAVYKGDVLYWHSSGEEFRVESADENTAYNDNGEGAYIGGLTWQRPKQEVWVVLIIDKASPTRVRALQYPYENEGAARETHPDALAIVKVEL